MKVIASIRNKIKKPSRSTVLFWVGWFIALFGAVIQLIIPSAQLFSFLLVAAGLLVAASQKIVGDREQDRKFDQERKRSDATAQDDAIRHSELRQRSNLYNRAPDSMPDRQSQITR